MKKLGGVLSLQKFSLIILGVAAAAGCDAGARSAGDTGTGGTSSGVGTTTSTGATTTGGSVGASGTTTSTGTGTTTTTTPPSCASASGPIAPNGYRVAGNSICDANGKAHLFHGVARPSLEWSNAGEHISLSDFQLMHDAWHANVVRIAMNQVFWLQNQNSYQATIDQAVQWAHQAGLDVILDLHWSGNPAAQQEMADQTSIMFWSQVAGKYQGDGRVLFELYNEPHDIAWNVWLSGDGNYAGMQQLYAAVRAAGANNVVIAGGVDWAYDLSGVFTHPVQGVNVAYATHPYAKDSEKAPAKWDEYWGTVAESVPVIVTEFGTLDCSTSYYSDLMTYADQHNASWTAWAWYPSGCSFPSIINDWSGAPNTPGALVQTQLKTYP